jgi:hypothetical protein
MDGCEIAHHLDSEMTAAIRLRLLVATPRPQIMGYDQDEFARRLHYDKRPIEASLDAFNAARRSTAEILDRLTEAEWLREGTHSEAGRYTPESWLEISRLRTRARQPDSRRPECRQAPRGLISPGLRRRVPGDAADPSVEYLSQYSKYCRRRAAKSRRAGSHDRAISSGGTPVSIC